MQGQCPRLLTCWLNHAMVCNIQILFTTFVFHTLSWKKSKYAQNKWWQRLARATSIKIYVSVFLPPNNKRKLTSPLTIKSTCLMTQQRLKGHLLWSRPSISWSLWLQFWPAAKAQENTRWKNRRFTIKKSQYLEAREAAKDNHNHIQKPDLDFFFLSFLTNLSRYEKIPTGLAVKLQFRKRAHLLLFRPLKYIIRGQLSLSKVLPNPALVGDRPPLQSNSCSLLKRCQLVGRLLQNP